MLYVGTVGTSPLPSVVARPCVEVGWGVLGPDMTYRAVNGFLADMNGLPASEHVGRTIREVLPESAHDIEELLQRARNRNSTVVDVPIQWVNAAGEERLSFVTYSADYSQRDNTFLGWTVLVRDAQVVDDQSTVEALRAIAALRTRIHRVRYAAAHGGPNIPDERNDQPGETPDGVGAGD